MKKIVLALIIVISVIFGIYMVKKNQYVHSEAVFVSTDSLTNLAFKIDGKIEKMTKLAGENVKKDEILAKLETKTLKTKLKEIEYKIKSQNHNIISISLNKEKLLNELNIKKNIAKNNLLEMDNKLKALNYQIKANEAKLDKLKFDKDKFYRLYKAKKVSYDKYQKIETEYKYLQNIIFSQKENYKALKIEENNLDKNLKLIQNSYKELNILDEKIETLYNQLESLKEIKKTILIKLNDSELKAPFSGVIAKKFVNKDMVVDAGSFVYSIVNPKDIYIKVLLSEKKLSGVKIGNKAIVKLDALDNEIEGKVEKIMPVSASTFSLVPRDIASGEFTKLDQRFIVKIKVPYNKNIRIGMSGEVKIYK